MLGKVLVSNAVVRVCASGSARILRLQFEKHFVGLLFSCSFARGHLFLWLAGFVCLFVVVGLFFFFFGGGGCLFLPLCDFCGRSLFCLFGFVGGGGGFFLCLFVCLLICCISGYLGYPPSTGCLILQSLNKLQTKAKFE